MLFLSQFSATWLGKLLLDTQGVAHAVIILALVAAVGLAIGAIRAWGISLGVAGVLFSGLIFGQWIEIEPEILEFAREFGLILFVYTIGLQVGPGFIDSLRRQGLPLNLMAAGIVVLGVVTTLGVWYFGMNGRADFPVAVGLFSGATTNTPSLGAAQQALKDALLPGEAISAPPGVGYAVAYPFGIIGIIIAMLAVRWVFRVKPEQEAKLLASLGAGEVDALDTMNLEVRNPNLDGLALKSVPMLPGSGVVISRILQGGRPIVPMGDTRLRLGDVLHAVGPKQMLEQMKLIIGQESQVDLPSIPSAISIRRVLVTHSDPLGKTVGELDLGRRFGVMVTRITRAGIELPVTGDTPLQYADNLVIVGQEDGLRAVAQELGDSPKRLDEPLLIPVFIGIALGVLVGSWPLTIPGIPGAVRLGLAGGPLIVAIILSRLGNIGPLVWYMPISANYMMRHIGIVLFLAAVGLNSGQSFFVTLAEGQGLYWMGLGALITIVPLLIVAFVARWFYKLNYLPLCGLLAGSMTDPPALAFAGTMTGSEAPSVAYATVYPLVMLLRVIAAQMMVLLFFR